MKDARAGADLAAALDPGRLMERAGLTPDPWQRRMLLRQGRRTLMMVTRQGGKSTTTAARALHKAQYTPGSLTLLLSPSQRQSAEIFEKVVAILRGQTDAGGVASAPRKLSALRVRFENESRIIALPGTEKTVRGYSGVDLLVIDEAARVDGDLYRSVRPMLAVSGGDLVALTTPWGKRGWFYHEWTDSASNEWERIKVTAKECPRITPEFLAEERRTMPEQWFRSEYLCEFSDTVDSAFSTDDIERMEGAEDVPLLFPSEHESAGGADMAIEEADDFAPLTL